ncbi:hypothetical protein HYV30_04350 [Candidatus Kaiserbacteria bacterium]|nr:hypothetical protein [Candidatus Kaiserbacteria bacterium]
MMNWLALGLALILNAAANVSLKAGSPVLTEGLSFATMPRVLTNPYLVGGIILFALNVVFYSYALTRLPLSLAYPTMIIGGLLIITTASAFIFGESLSYLQASGLSLIVLGVILLYA